MQEPGAFLWWYLDLVDADGSGLVLIWSFGLPFLPGLRRATRTGADARPASWPALNLALYDRGRPAFYALQRLAPRNACWRTHEDHDEWRFGDTGITRTRAGGEVHVRAELDVTLPAGERAAGVVELHGRERRACPDEDASDGLPRHRWTPVSACARGRAALSLSGEPFVVDGRAYHDANGGAVPLWDLDLRRWLWGRVPYADGELVFFSLWPRAPSSAPETLLLTVEGSGATHSARGAAVTLGKDRLRWSGLRLPRELDLRFSSVAGASERVRLVRRSVVDEGPFYARLLVELAKTEAVSSPGRALGFVESVVPRRVDLSRHRPFVRMRVHDLTAGCSPWLPLFCGRARGRATRLSRAWLSSVARRGPERA